MLVKEYYTLYNGVKIPKIGYGTWQIPNDIASRCVQEAIETGFIHIDTAWAYQNQVGVGEGLKESKVDRDKIFITTKVPAEIKSYKEAKNIIDDCLKKLDLEYIDLILIHAPKPWRDIINKIDSNYDKENLEVWKALTEAYNDKKVRSIGVSNFSVKDLKNIMDNSTIKPMVNQIAIHIKNYPKEVIDFCQANDILVEAYSPLATGRILDDPKIKEMADYYNVSVSRLCIKYTLQLNTLSLPKTTHKEYMLEDIDVDNFTISDEHMNILNNL